MTLDPPVTRVDPGAKGDGSSVQEKDREGPPAASEVFRLDSSFSLGPSWGRRKVGTLGVEILGLRATLPGARGSVPKPSSVLGRLVSSRPGGPVRVRGVRTPNASPATWASPSSLGDSGGPGPERGAATQGAAVDRDGRG